MKLFLSLFMIFTSSITFAARLPTKNELLKYEDQIRKSGSITSVLNDIKSGKIDPIVSLDRVTDTIYVEKGVSEMAYTLILNRFDARKPLGNEQENLELLNTLIKAGINLNYLPEPKFYENIRSLMDAASTVCSPSAINLLIKNGANPGLEDFYWITAFRQWFQAEIGSQFDKNCFAVAELLSDKTNSLGMRAIEKLFFPFIFEDYGGLGSFSQGGGLDIDLSLKMKLSLEKNMGIKLSKKPEGVSPTEEWIQSFFSMMAVVRGQDDNNRGQDWWNKLSEKEKAWACYYSSFDEALNAYHNLGITDHELTTKTVGGSYVIFSFDKFPVYVFGPYCNSIK